jgi:hypothetical protein
VLNSLDAGPVSTALLRYDTLEGAVGGYGKGHYVSLFNRTENEHILIELIHTQGPLLIYTGIMMTLGGVCGIVYR